MKEVVVPSLLERIIQYWHLKHHPATSHQPVWALEHWGTASRRDTRLSSGVQSASTPGFQRI